VAFAPVTLPPPLATAKVTATLGTGRLAASRTTTAGAMLRAYPVSPVWPSPGPADTLAGALGCTAVAVKVTGLPVIPEPATVAVSVFSPAPGPSVQRPTVATPFPSVWVAPPDTVPPPAVAANVTADGRVARTTPVCPSPPALMSWAAACATDTVTWALNPPVVATA